MSIFSGCENLVGNITLPASVTNIQSYAFYRCNNITSITIPPSVKTIEKYAFTQSGTLQEPKTYKDFKMKYIDLTLWDSIPDSTYEWDEDAFYVKKPSNGDIPEEWQGTVYVKNSLLTQWQQFFDGVNHNLEGMVLKGV